MKNLQQLLNARVIGNAYSDMHLINDICEFVTCTNNSMSERQAALNFLNNTVMGLESLEASEQDVLDVAEQEAEMRGE